MVEKRYYGAWGALGKYESNDSSLTEDHPLLDRGWTGHEYFAVVHLFGSHERADVRHRTQAFSFTGQLCARPHKYAEETFAKGTFVFMPFYIFCNSFVSFLAIFGLFHYLVSLSIFSFFQKLEKSIQFLDFKSCKGINLFSVFHRISMDLKIVISSNP